MERIFSIIAAISIVMVLLSGSGSYWLSAAKVTGSEKTAIEAVARGLASGIAMHMDIMQQTVDSMARSPEVIAALKTGDPGAINMAASKLQSIMPGALRIRLLSPSINEPDQTQTPYMGFGDLEMVRATITDKQKPVIQGEGENRHLAITSPIIHNQRVIGVVLASLKTDLINRTITNSNFSKGYAEIKQDQIVLTAAGNESNKINDPESIEIANSRWTINVWPESSSKYFDTGLIASIIVIPSLLSGLAFFIGYRKLAEYLVLDQGSILKAAKDMMTGKHVGNYPIQLNEMRPIISTLAQLKRVITQFNNPVQTPTEIMEPDMFNESFDIDFLEDSTPIFTDQLETMPGRPVSMPNLTASPIVPEVPSPPVPEPEPIPVSSPPPTPAFILNNEKLPADVFGNHGVQGIYGEALNDTLVYDIGRAVATEARQLGIKLIAVARDGRLSSQSLADALAKGICRGGCDVMDIGLVPSPMLYFVAHHCEGRSGIMVTGGHNPPEYNGLKIVLNGETIANDRIQDLKLRIEAEDYSLDEPGSIEENNLFTNEYIGIISEDFHIARPMKVVIDCANGAASQLAPILLKTLGCEVIELFCDIDGSFPNHLPDPSIPKNLTALGACVIQHGADVGVAFDSDGGRLGIVDSKGNAILADKLLMIFSREILAKKPNSKIVYDVNCSKHLHNEIIKRGGQPIIWKTGYPLIKAKVKEIGAALAGELSGHIFFNDRWFGFDDAIYASVRLIQILSEDSRSSYDVFAELPEGIHTPEIQVVLPEGEHELIIEQMFKLANFKDGELIDIDGMRVEFADGWGLVRPSNTGPELKMRFEADNEQALSRIQGQFKSLLLQIKPNISLPF